MGSLLCQDLRKVSVAIIIGNIAMSTVQHSSVSTKKNLPVRIGGTTLYTVDTKWNNGSLGKCFRANSRWHV